MKIGILTHYYNSTNYGGNLQAYALCKVLEQLGHRPEQVQIDHSGCYQNLLLPQKRDLKQQVKNLARPLVRLLIPHYRKKWQAQAATRQPLLDAFARFNRQLIPHSEKVYTRANIRSSLTRYDIFITGSDQVFNPIWYFPPYFLDFVPACVPKLSYAASIGHSTLPAGIKKRYQAHLKSFIGISVREADGVSLLADIAPVEPQWVLDPTMLLSRENWLEVAQKPNIDAPYLFCYFLGNDPASREAAAACAKKRGLTLVTIPNATGLQHSNDAHFGDLRLADPSPEAFLGLIAGAEQVFTDSFHATVFALLFHRQFITFPREGHGSSRITSLLQLFDAQSHFCAGQLPDKLPEMDYSVQPEAFTRALHTSRSWLETSLQKAKEMLP